ncbi:hypothetical protein [Aquimarina algiphila]|uniref:hypothetical protein n=1 Tax=Aquimarina algiphila TaxID=2047982 RepID=UPI002493580D|nr:hypothetical protein [Aquimarina algiphila]
MKTKISILTISLLAIFSCSKSKKKVKQNYSESQTTFFQLRHGDWTSNQWIRNPQNLKTIHETFMKFGYIDLIGNRLGDNPFILQDLYIKKEPSHLIDSLILTFKNKELNVKYYREFWSRREQEKNDTVVYEILKDIKHSFKSKHSSTKQSMNVNEDFVNDTLYQLIKVEYFESPLTKEVAIKNFEKLVDLGFHESAYNLLYERSEYSEIDWNKEELLKKLKTTETYVYPWFEDNTK